MKFPSKLEKTKRWGRRRKKNKEETYKAKLSIVSGSQLYYSEQNRGSAAEQAWNPNTRDTEA